MPGRRARERPALFEPLPRSTIAALAGGLSAYGVFVLVGAPVGISISTGTDLRWAVDVGAEVAKSLSWSIPSVISVLIAFYAVVIGGQILEVDNLRSVRNSLGMVSSVIGATSIVALVYVSIHASANPRTWGTVAVLVAFVILIGFLTLNIGFLMTTRADHADVIREQIALTDDASMRVRKLTASLNSASAGARILGPAATVGLSTAGGLAIAFSIYGSATSFEQALGLPPSVSLSFLCVAFLADNRRATYLRVTESRIARAAWVLPIMVGVVVLLTASGVAPAAQPAAVATGAAIFLATGLCYLPLRWVPSGWRAYTVRGFAALLALRTLRLRRLKLEKELSELRPDQSPGVLLGRLRAVVSGRRR